MKKTENRVVNLVGEIDDTSVQKFMDRFSELDATKGSIRVNICSPGGFVYGGLALFDLLSNSKNDVTTYALGDTSSAAVLVLQGGHQRVAGPNCTLFLHEVWSCGISGTYDEIKFQNKHLKKLHEIYCEVLSKRSGLALNKVKKMCNQENFLSAHKAWTLNLVDEVMGDKINAKTRFKK